MTVEAALALLLADRPDAPLRPARVTSDASRHTVAAYLAPIAPASVGVVVTLWTSGASPRSRFTDRPVGALSVRPWHMHDGDDGLPRSVIVRPMFSFR